MRTERLFDCRVFSVERSIAASPEDGTEHDFYRLLSPDWVQVVPITADGEVVLIRQYRHGAKTLSLEIPAGMIDQGESPAEAAVRECLEETGYLAPSVRSLGAINPNPALFANRVHSYYALDVVHDREIQNTPTEQTVVELAPLEEIPGLLRSGAIDHALDAMALWSYLDTLR